MKNQLLILLFITSGIFTTYGQGALFNEEKFMEFEQLEATRGFLPSIVSYQNYAPYSTVQINGSCVAHAFANAMVMGMAINEDIEDRELIFALKPSPLQIYYFNRQRTDIDCENGLYMSDVANHLLEYGASSWAEVEYPAGYWPFGDYIWCNYYPPSIEEHLSNAFFPRKIFALESLDQIKTALNSGIIVAAGMETTQSFMNCESFVWEPKEWESLDGGHAVTIVGYMDDFEENEGAFLILNSYGQEWGENGFTWIKYKDAVTYFIQAYAVDMVGNYQQFGRQSQDLPIVKGEIDQVETNEWNAGVSDRRTGVTKDSFLKEIQFDQLYNEYIKNLD